PTADFEIPLRELRGLHDSNDRIRASLRKLQTTLIAARLPNGKTRTVQLLGGCDIDDDERTDGLLKYDFHRKLVPLLRHSEIYARMEMKVLTAMSSKYSLALYEALSLRINLRRSSEDITLETLRNWLSVEEGKLATWNTLRQKAIEPAVKEVNALSPFEVSIEPIKRGRKVERVRVTWAKKEPFSPSEQAAAREVNRARTGRKARVSGTVETVADRPTLTDDEIQKGYEAAAQVGARLDKHAAYSDWQNMVSSFAEPVKNPVAHFIAFCKERARSLE
ncbi:replication initiation protein, partial [Lujinxingia vulgaris]